MADDVDDLLRRTMASLDRETPAGYFDELPGRTLARLDAASAADDPGDELARQRAARTARTAPALSSEQSAAGAATRRPGRRWRVGFALAGTGIAAAVTLLLFTVTTQRADEPSYAASASVPAAAGAPNSAQLQHAYPEPPPMARVMRSPPEDSLGQGASLDVAFDRGLLGSAAPGLAADDFRAGMQAVVAQARRCLPPGPRGSVTLEVTVQSSGEVSQVTAPPPYAATAAEACVSRAVKSHTFPSWSGSPQTFRYRLPTWARVRGVVDSGEPTMK
jgi:hypothetical protein